mmetsp:Transcript_15415/g.45424  ORF Transcript_15415/g.45424 Transcript_15415/m.45424 type:complete len:299 (-) Transcript_15415:2992-3888(-)|eukprot:363552-Chlamydomonas_euryale.AAC.13
MAVAAAAVAYPVLDPALRPLRPAAARAPSWPEAVVCLAGAAATSLLPQRCPGSAVRLLRRHPLPQGRPSACAAHAGASARGRAPMHGDGQGSMQRCSRRGCRTPPLPPPPSLRGSASRTATPPRGTPARWPLHSMAVDVLHGGRCTEWQPGWTLCGAACEVAPKRPQRTAAARCMLPCRTAPLPCSTALPPCSWAPPAWRRRVCTWRRQTECTTAGRLLGCDCVRVQAPPCGSKLLTRGMSPLRLFGRQHALPSRGEGGGRSIAVRRRGRGCHVCANHKRCKVWIVLSVGLLASDAKG